MSLVHSVDIRMARETVRATLQNSLGLTRGRALVHDIAELDVVARKHGVDLHNGGRPRSTQELSTYGRVLARKLRIDHRCPEDASVLLLLDRETDSYLWELAAAQVNRFLSLERSIARVLPLNIEHDRDLHPLVQHPSALLIPAPRRHGLPSTLDEVHAIRDLLADRQVAANVMEEDSLTTRAVAAVVRSGQWQIIHFSGHVENGCWMMDDGPMGIEDLTEDFESIGYAPALVFSNGCTSNPQSPAGPTNPRSRGPAERLAQIGVPAFIGTRWPVEDRAAQDFALSFYRELVSGATVGRAMLSARRATHEEHPLDWAAYLLYGDPLAQLGCAGSAASTRAPSAPFTPARGSWSPGP